MSGNTHCKVSKSQILIKLIHYFIGIVVSSRWHNQAHEGINMHQRGTNERQTDVSRVRVRTSGGYEWVQGEYERAQGV